MLYIVTIHTAEGKKIRHIVWADTHAKALGAIRLLPNTGKVSVEPVSGDVIRSEEEETIDLDAVPDTIGF